MEDEFLIELLMVLVDKLGGKVEVTEDDLERVLDGVNELRMVAPDGLDSTSIGLSISRDG